MNTQSYTTEQLEEDSPDDRVAAEVVQSTHTWKVSVNQDQILKHPELAVFFKRPYITRTGLIMPNRVVAEFDNHAKNDAIALFYDVKAKGLTVLRNWLG